MAPAPKQPRTLPKDQRPWKWEWEGPQDWAQGKGWWDSAPARAGAPQSGTPGRPHARRAPVTLASGVPQGTGSLRLSCCRPQDPELSLAALSRVPNGDGFVGDDAARNDKVVASLLRASILR